MRKLYLFAFIFALLPSLAIGQYYFGQNKVQYTDFDWQVLKTDNFDVYFYPEEEQIAQVAAKMAEDSYVHHVEKFNHVIDKKIPLIIYSSPTFFYQTNVTPYLLPEGVAGFTEYFKERVVVHYHGSHEDLQKLIQHELTHVFQMNKVTYVCRAHRKRNPPRPPLWFTEGLAEYWSEGWSTEADMVIRDMVISGNIVPFERLYTISGSYFMYKVGQSICQFMSETYGDDKLTLLYENWWKEPSFDLLVKNTYGVPLAEIGKQWEYYLKKKYYPHLEDQTLPENVATKLTVKSYNVKPTVFTNLNDNGEERQFVAFKTYRMGYTNIALMPLSGENSGLKRIIKGQRSAKFESLHFIDSKIDAYDDGRLTFVSKSHESDVLYVYDTKENKIIESYRFEGLINVSSPSWSPEGERIAFSGTTMDGQTDIYLYTIESDELKRLTDDFYYDLTPTFSHDGRHIAFSSDRDGDRGINIFSYDLRSGSIKQLTFGESENLSPQWASQNDRMLFTSDVEGVPNIYMIDEPTGEEPKLVQLTDFVTGAFDPEFTSNDSAIVFSAYQNNRYNIYSMELDSALAMTEHERASQWSSKDSWNPEVLGGSYIKGNVKYKTKLSFDIAQSVMSYDAVFGSVGGLQGALTDMLGNHQYYFLVYNTADTREDLLNSMNAAVTYINRKKRINWGFGAFRFYNEYTDDYYGFLSEQTFGGLFLASYPFSRYDRIESSLYIRDYRKNTILSEDPSALVGTSMLSYIKDTSLWGPSGPIDGFRMHLTLAASLDLKKAKYYNSQINVDIRKYFRLTESSAFAVRGMYFRSMGEDPQRYYLGGSWDLRGYPRRSFHGKKLVLFNNELRFPLINRLFIGFPFGAMNFSAIRGALFFDAGKAWEEDMERLAGSFGFGFRVSLGYVTVLRFDFARRTDFKTVSKDFDFDFFFGWNY